MMSYVQQFQPKYNYVDTTNSQSGKNLNIGDFSNSGTPNHLLITTRQRSHGMVMLSILSVR